MGLAWLDDDRERRPGFFVPESRSGDSGRTEGGEKVDIGNFTPERIAGPVAEAIPQESGEERHFKYGSPEKMVCL